MFQDAETDDEIGMNTGGLQFLPTDQLGPVTCKALLGGVSPLGLGFKSPPFYLRIIPQNGWPVPPIPTAVVENHATATGLQLGEDVVNHLGFGGIAPPVVARC